MGRSKGSRTISWMKYRTLWDGVSVALILRFYPERVEAKRGNGSFSASVSSGVRHNDERARFHSITSSARARSVGGTWIRISKSITSPVKRQVCPMCVAQSGERRYVVKIERPARGLA